MVLAIARSLRVPRSRGEEAQREVAVNHALEVPVALGGCRTHRRALSFGLCLPSANRSSSHGFHQIRDTGGYSGGSMVGIAYLWFAQDYLRSDGPGLGGANVKSVEWRLPDPQAPHQVYA
jgi:hypothetical protein